MKLSFQKRRDWAWTITEVLVVIATLVFLAAVLLPVLAATHRRSARLGCSSNLRQLNLAFRIWEGDNNNQYPMTVSVTNGGAMELMASNNLAGLFLRMTNELGTPKVLICPCDETRFPATSFDTNFSNANINYFINPDANESYPQEIMSGDDNLAINDVPVKSGLVVIPSGATVSWTADRHAGCGNIGYADGSVAEESSVGLQSSFILGTNGTPATTTRFAIP
jgi:prepilin-type processing-associated H-X9-DG protein